MQKPTARMAHCNCPGVLVLAEWIVSVGYEIIGMRHAWIMLFWDVGMPIL
jgi:hypothetical protein